MSFDTWINIIINVFLSLVIIIPLGVKLYRTIKDLVKEQNWPVLMGYAIKYMAMAEKDISEGAQKKQWVLDSLKTTAQNIGYNLTDSDLAKIGEMIDSICDASKVIN